MKKFFENSFFLLIVRVISKIITIVVISILARYFGKENFGLYGSLISLGMFAGVISDFGLILPNIRSLSKKEESINILISKLFDTRFIYGFVGIIIVNIIGYFLNFPFLLLLIISLSSVFEITVTNLIRLIEGLQKYKLLTFLILIERIFYAVTVLSSIYFYNSILALSISILVGYFFLFIFILIYFEKIFGKIKYNFDLENVVQLSKKGLPFGLTILFSTIFYKSDLIIINNLLGNEKSGVYGAVIRVFDSQMFIPLTFMTILFPHFSKLFIDKKESFAKDFKKYLILFSISSLVISMLIFLFASNIILILYSSEFSDSIIYLKYFSVVLLINFVNTFLSHIIISVHKEKHYLLILAVTTISCIIANYLFIPVYNLYAPIFIRLSAEIILFSSMLYILITNKFYLNE